ncbi:MAG TPA: serine/threonine-protein kinase [Phycisphaerales bacterium]|nr:serine/threonine-protein kinase [Phycisphaerales bacterium]
MPSPPLDLVDDDVLADHIRTEGVARLDEGTPVSLDRYLALIPSLPQRPVPLDAALDVVLRSMSGSGTPTAEAMISLIKRHPDLEGPIREAAMLSGVFATGAAHSAGRQELMLPTEFGPPIDAGRRRYELREHLGTGSQGSVYLAVDRTLSDEGHAALVAIKIINQSERMLTDRMRLIDEAAKARRIDHPNVVRVIDRGESESGDDYIVYEHVPGGSIESIDAMPLGRDRTRRAVALMCRVARGVHAAHSAGLIHCDLKPSNILLADVETPKITDFGIAVRRDDLLSAPDVHLWRGTLAFTSPEQFNGEPGADSVPADVFSLGGILYFLIRGRLACGETAKAIADRLASPGEIIAGTLLDAPCGADADLEAICRRALAREPGARHASASELANDLERWLECKPIVWRNPSPLRRGLMWMKRSPLAAAATIGLLTALCLSGFAIAGLEYVDGRERLYDESQRNMEILGEKISNPQWESKGLYVIWILEWIGGTSVMGDAKFKEYLFDHREQIIRARLERARQEGRDNDVEPLMWETSLAFWLLEDAKKYDHAELAAILDHNLTGWLRTASPEDWTIETVRMLRAAATARSIGEIASKAGKPTADQHQELLRCAGTLRHYVDEAPPSVRHSPMRVLAMRALRHVHAPSLLHMDREWLHWDEEMKRCKDFAK